MAPGAPYYDSVSGLLSILYALMLLFFLLAGLAVTWWSWIGVKWFLYNYVIPYACCLLPCTFHFRFPSAPFAYLSFYAMGCAIVVAASFIAYWTIPTHIVVIFRTILQCFPLALCFGKYLCWGILHYWRPQLKAVAVDSPLILSSSLDTIVEGPEGEVDEEFPFVKDFTNYHKCNDGPG